MKTPSRDEQKALILQMDATGREVDRLRRKALRGMPYNWEDVDALLCLGDRYDGPAPADQRIGGDAALVHEGIPPIEQSPLEGADGPDRDAMPRLRRASSCLHILPPFPVLSFLIPPSMIPPNPFSENPTP